MELEVQTRVLMSAEDEFAFYARNLSRIMDEMQSVRRHLSEMSAMDYAMVQLRKTGMQLEEQRYACRQFSETLEYAARHYANADRDVEERTPQVIRQTRSILERLHIVDPFSPFVPIWTVRFWRRIWDVVFRYRVPLFLPGWLPIWIVPGRPYGFLPYPLPAYYRPPQLHILRLVNGTAAGRMAAQYINRMY